MTFLIWKYGNYIGNDTLLFHRYSLSANYFHERPMGNILKAYRDNGCLTKNLRNLLTRLVLRNEKDLAFHSVQIHGKPDHLRKFM